MAVYTKTYYLRCLKSFLNGRDRVVSHDVSERDALRDLNISTGG